MTSVKHSSRIFPALLSNIQRLVGEFATIHDQRKDTLRDLAAFLRTSKVQGISPSLVFICTHNSRRSHIAQVWAHTAAAYYGINGIRMFSGGTETTAVNPRALHALGEAGFKIEQLTEGENPRYKIRIGENIEPLVLHSKKFDAPENPTAHFAAVMTCSEADENCPFIPGATVRIPLPYEDPKNSDGSPEEAIRYGETVQIIGKELLYAFSEITAGS